MRRPLASGTVSVSAAAMLAALLGIAGLVAGLCRVAGGSLDPAGLCADEHRLYAQAQACGDPGCVHHRHRLHAAHPRRHAGDRHSAFAVAAAVRPDGDAVPRFHQAPRGDLRAERGQGQSPQGAGTLQPGAAGQDDRHHRRRADHELQPVHDECRTRYASTARPT